MEKDAETCEDILRTETVAVEDGWINYLKLSRLAFQMFPLPLAKQILIDVIIRYLDWYDIIR